MADYSPAAQHDGPLTAAEDRELQRLLGRIKQGASMAAEALAAIHAGRLYRAYGTWEEFCKVALGYCRQRGYQLLGQGIVSTNVGAPVSEAVARELVSRPPALQKATVQIAGQEATAAEVREVAELLENMTPAEQAAAVATEEARLLTRHQAAGKGRDYYVAAITRHLEAAKKLFTHLPDVLPTASKRIAGLLGLAESSSAALG